MSRYNQGQTDRNKERVIDETKEYLERRYVSGMEAAYRIFQFELSRQSYSVIALPVHPLGDRDANYKETDDVSDIERRLHKQSKSEAWFALHRIDADAGNYRYDEVPEHYVWNDRLAIWTSRLQTSKQIGDIIEVTPIEGQSKNSF